MSWGAPLKPRLAIIGVGLMGGSLARALRGAAYVSEILGLDADPDVLARAQALGIIDRGLTRLEEGVADIIVLATPVATLPGLLLDMKAPLRTATVAFDMGSVKGPVTDAAQKAGLTRFIPCHPMAGAECSGPEAARDDLFAGRVVVLTPEAHADPQALQAARSLWEAVGARIVLAPAQAHDRLVAYTSHLPHLLAFACADFLAQQGPDSVALDFIGTGLRDFLRIAGSDPVMWRDICATNSVFLADALAGYGQYLIDYGAALRAGDGVGLHAHFARARAFYETVNEEPARGKH